MKRAAIAVAVLGVAAYISGQQATAQNSSKPGAQSAPTGQAAPTGKRLPQAKTQAEFDAYKAAAALTDPAAQEKAANDFATKYPDSELRPLLYKAVMGAYQQANNADKMMEMGRKILAIDADDPDALLGVAQGLAESTQDTDLDRDQKLAEAKKDAQRALVTVDTDVPTAGVAPERLSNYQAYVRSQAYDILGTIESKNKAWADAEADLKKSIDAFPQSVDPVAVLRLALALDMQGKYPEALKYADQAVDLTKAGTSTGDAARSERDRLKQLTAGAAPGKN